MWYLVSPAIQAFQKHILSGTLSRTLTCILIRLTRCLTHLTQLTELTEIT